MGRINRRIYATRRKRSSAFKLRFANPGNMSSELINQMGQAQASGSMPQLNTYTQAHQPPYLGGNGGGEGFGGGKTYTITEA